MKNISGKFHDSNTFEVILKNDTFTLKAINEKSEKIQIDFVFIKYLNVSDLLKENIIFGIYQLNDVNDIQVFNEYSISNELIEKINEGKLSLFTIESSYGIQAIIVSESYLIT